MNDRAATIAANLRSVNARIASAARRTGRDPSSVTLVAITKYVGIEEARVLVEAGCRDLGESRPQELWQKAEALRDLDVRWHLVGHLQRNKARRTLPYLHCLHSADSRRLLEELNKLAHDGPSNPCRILLEVNISGDPAKHGLNDDELIELAPALDQFPHLHVTGLMAMAALDHPGEAARADFRRLADLRDRVAPLCPSGITLGELSMGMSGDFEQAVEEGATLVRVGSLLFEGI